MATFISVVRCGCLSLIRDATLPVLISSLVVPPAMGVKTSLDSPKVPWQLAHCFSQRSWPLATEPDPAGSPLKSGRTSISHAATSAGVALRPIFKYAGFAFAAGALCAIALVFAETASATNRRVLRIDLDIVIALADLNIADLAIGINLPRLNCIVVIDRARTAYCP